MTTINLKINAEELLALYFAMQLEYESVFSSNEFKGERRVVLRTFNKLADEVRKLQKNEIKQ